MRLVFSILCVCCNLGSARAQTNADWWFTNAVPLPFAGLSSNLFAALRADAVSGHLQINWTPSSPLPPGSEVSVYASTDPIGHWPARDWRSHPLHPHGAVWQGNVPVESLDIPLAYFVAVRAGTATNASPVRICRPRALGIEIPSKLFWPFVEGFEQGLESWRAVSAAALQLSSAAKNGKSALSVTIAAGKRSATVVTTRCRGWLLEERGAAGFAFWARTRSGTGQLRCSLVADAFTPAQATAQSTNLVSLNSTWKRQTLALSDYSNFPLGELDLLSFEFIGEPGTEFLLDDLYLLGRWRFD